MPRSKHGPRGVVAGVFDDQKAAAHAIAQLVEAHFEPEDDLSVVLTDEWTEEHEAVPIREELEIVEGAKIGGGLGAVIGATGAAMVAAGVLAGPAALVAVGPVIAALEGGLAVGAVGSVAGWLVGLGVMREEADFHAARIEEGAVWVGVQATGERATKAREVLAEAGARFFDETRS